MGILDKFRRGESTLDFEEAPPESLPQQIAKVPNVDRTAQCHHKEITEDGLTLRCTRRVNHAGRHLAIHPKKGQHAFGEGVHGRYFRLNYNRGGK